MGAESTHPPLDSSTGTDLFSARRTGISTNWATRMTTRKEMSSPPIGLDDPPHRPQHRLGRPVEEVLDPGQGGPGWIRNQLRRAYGNMISQM